jgi:hypothetical protein
LLYDDAALQLEYCLNRGLEQSQTGEVFIGDVMVVYNTYLDKVNRSCKILRVDMTDENGMMTVTLTVPAHLIERHEQKIIPGAGISITNFKILPKTGYERGDCDRVISLLESSVIETMPPTCKEYNFIQTQQLNNLQIIHTCIQLALLELSSPLLEKLDAIQFAYKRWKHR